MMNIVNPFRVLRCQGRCRCHCVASMGGNDLLVRLETTGIIRYFLVDVGVTAYAPPELSEPAITRIRRVLMVKVDLVLQSVC